VALRSYSYCGGTFDGTAFIANLDYNKVVTLYYTNRQNESTPLSSLTFAYSGPIAGTNWELWTASTAVYIDGITELLNITYQATDIGQTYVQTLNLPVEATGASEPTLPAPPAPYATPEGFSDDITAWLAVNSTGELETAFQRMFLNINPAVAGAAKGIVVAARSGPYYDQTDPDYAYNWVRDASLTMDVVRMLYAAATNAHAKSQYEQILFEYATARATEQNDPNLQTGLGEPKFYLNNTIFSGPWGRPQNDGPATAAITLIEFATAYLSSGGSLSTVQQTLYDSDAYPASAPVKKDLLFVATNWSSPSYDLWEEAEGTHFYTRLVQRRALVLGAAFATTLNDPTTASTLTTAAQALTATLPQFWDPNRQALLYEYGPVLHAKTSYLDTAVILAVLHGYAHDNIYGPTNDQVLSSALRIATAFIPIYPLATTTHDAQGRILGIPLGRYPEDVYNGTGTEPDGGNPWYLCTAAMAQLLYSASACYASAQQINVTETSKPFFDYFTPLANLTAGRTYEAGTEQYYAVLRGLDGWGDAFMRTVKAYTPEGGRLAEEFNRVTGEAQGAADLTWSYAAVLTAGFARAETRQRRGYVGSLADL
ncbi:glucoamylase precursor, partial [Teratosphaeria nubilosa]